MQDGPSTSAIVDKILKDVKNVLENSTLEIVGSDVMREMVAAVCMEANKNLATALQEAINTSLDIAKEVEILKQEVHLLKLKLVK